LGRVWLRSELIRREVTQARLQDEVRHRPGLLATPLPRPLMVVVGLPRTGTTLLHTLLGCDPVTLVLPFWQLRRPYPIPPRRLERAARIMRAAAMAGLARSMAPRLRDIHPVSALRPEEDVFLFRDTGMLVVPVAAPGYLGWLQATEPTPAYRTYRRHLQALLADRPGRRPVLKSPFHLGRLGALLAEVPEAVVVWTHRDPAVALASWCSLAAVLANAAGDQVDLDALGRRWLGFWATELDRALTARATADPARFHDVDYQALVADPLGEVERLHARLGLALSGTARRRMRRWIGRHHHRRRGRPHRYCLADFGLDPAVVDRRFARYRHCVAAGTWS
jgi:hypothetical protein